MPPVSKLTKHIKQLKLEKEHLDKKNKQQGLNELKHAKKANTLQSNLRQIEQKQLDAFKLKEQQFINTLLKHRK